MARPRTSKHWDHPTYRWAYVREYRGGAATVIRGGDPIQTGLKFVPAAKAEAIKILCQRVDEYRLREEGIIAKATALPEGVMTVGALFEDFLTCAVKMSDKRQKRIASEMGHTPLNELASNTKAITSYVLKSVAETGNDTNTQRFTLKAIRQVFRFGVERGHIRVNPIPLDVIPDEEVEDPTPYTLAQIRRIETLYDGGRLEAYLRFLIASRCRPIEACRVYPNDVYTDHCVVYSFKGRKKTKIRRVIPFALCPGAKEAIDMMRPPKGEKWVGPVFQWKNYQNVADKVRELLGDENLGLYGIRSWGINAWKRAGWPEDVRHAIAGHSKEIAEKHYESKWSASELVTKVAGNMPETSSTKRHKNARKAA